VPVGLQHFSIVPDEFLALRRLRRLPIVAGEILVLKRLQRWGSPLRVPGTWLVDCARSARTHER